MKYTQILVSCLAAGALAATYLASDHVKSDPNHPVDEPAATAQATPETEIAPEPAPAGVSADAAPAARGEPAGVEVKTTPEPKMPRHDPPPPEGVYSAALAPYLGDLHQMLATMRQVATTQQAVAYEQELRADLPRLSPHVTNYIVGLAEVGSALQADGMTPDLVQAQALLGELETMGAALEAEMVRIEGVHPAISALFAQFCALHE